MGIVFLLVNKYRTIKFYLIYLIIMFFSEYFWLWKEQLELDFVDIPIEWDIQLFIDPYAIANQYNRRSIETHNKIIHFFNLVLEYIQKRNIEEALYMLWNLNECHDIHFWFSKKDRWGKGIWENQWQQLYDALKNSKAVATWFLEDLEDCSLLIEWISNDKISDITVRIILDKLIEYTQEQCDLWGIPMEQVPSDSYRNSEKRKWEQKYVSLPIINIGKTRKRIVLIPKHIARYKLLLDADEYYNHYMLNFLQEAYVRAGDSLCRTLKTGEIRPPHKKVLRKIHRNTKEYLVSFSRENKDVYMRYKKKKADLANNSFLEQQREHNIELKIQELQSIPIWTKGANKYHDCIMWCLTYIFENDLILPKKECEIHEGRKRIDIVYTNTERKGSFFNDLAVIKNIPSAYIMIECKNYTNEIKNPELDQMAWRFSPNRWKFWIIVCRRFEDKDLFYKRCKDTCLDDRGFIIALDDNDIEKLMLLKKSDNLRWIYNLLDSYYQRII